MTRRTLTGAVLVAVLLSVAVPPAVAKSKPKPDRTPPVSTIHTEDMALRAGVDGEPPEPVRALTLVEGTSRDNKRGLIDYVVIRFTREDPVGGHLGAIEVDTCEPPHRTCNWSATVPDLDDKLIQADPMMGVMHALPAVWDVQVKAYDKAGNVETNGPAIQIVVI
jgi:hypothetical protein